MRVRGSLVMVLFVAACAEKSPRAVLDEYKAALAKGDVARAVQLSDASLRSAYEKRDHEISAAELKAAADRVERAGGEGTLWCEIDGVRMVREPGGWKVSEGGLELGRFETPELALESFFFGVRAKAWSIVRRAIPLRHRGALASDEALEAHLKDLAARIERAERDVGELTPGRAKISGDKAELPYGDGRRVTFEREDGAWRVLDLE